MNHTPKIIGISGNARSGKDSLCKVISDCLQSDGLKAHRLAFADEVKREVDDLLKNTVGISAFTDDTKEKNIIRPVLVFWGTEFRGAMNQNVWVDKVIEQMTDPEVVYIVTDVRFIYEAEALKERGAHMIHLQRFNGSRQIIPPANDYEAKNNPILHLMCDQTISWNGLTTHEERLDFINKHYYNTIKNYVTH